MQVPIKAYRLSQYEIQVPIFEHLYSKLKTGNTPVLGVQDVFQPCRKVWRQVDRNIEQVHLVAFR